MYVWMLLLVLVIMPLIKTSFVSMYPIKNTIKQNDYGNNVHVHVRIRTSLAGVTVMVPSPPRVVVWVDGMALDFRVRVSADWRGEIFSSMVGIYASVHSV